MMYYQVTKKMSKVFDVRLRMVRMGDSEGISAAVRELVPEIDAKRAVRLRHIALGQLIRGAYHVPALPKVV